MRCSWVSHRLSVVSFLLVVAALIGAIPRVASAQTIVISQTGIKRSVPMRADPTARFKVSRADCLADDVIEFPAIVNNYGGTQLEVWATQASDACTSDVARATNSATCWRVYSATPNNMTTTIRVRVQDISARPPTIEGQNVGTEASCNSNVSTAQPVTLYFMFLQGVALVGSSASWATSVDLLGPAPPLVEAMDPTKGTGAGDRLLKVGWASNTDPDVLSYRLFCENLGDQGGTVVYHDAATPFVAPSFTLPNFAPQTDGGTTCVDGGTDPDASCPPDPGTGGQDGGTGGSGGTDAGGGGGGSSATGGSGGSGGSGASDGGGTTPGCGTVLVQGKTLSLAEMEKHLCGIAQGGRSTRATIEGLTNYSRYAIAVVAADLVENIGVLSDVQCAVPKPVNGFDEAYRSAGGTAGGPSFCSISGLAGASQTKLGSGVALLVGLFALLARRRRASISTAVR